MLAGIVASTELGLPDFWKDTPCRLSVRLSCWVLEETVHYGLSVSWREVWPLWTLAFCERLGGVQPLSRRQVLQLVKGWGKVQPSSRRGSAPTHEGLGGCNPMPRGRHVG